MGPCEQEKMNFNSERYRQAETVGCQTATRQAEIPAQVSFLEERIAGLSELIERLKSRLEIVSNDGSKQGCCKSEAIDQAPMCDLAHKIWESKNGVEMIMATVQGILNRLEL